MLEQAIKDKKERLYFLARDGWLMYQVAKLIVEKRQLPIEIRYLRVSRYAIRTAEYYVIGDKCLDTICVGGIDITFEKIMKRANLSESEAEQIARKIDFLHRYHESLNYQQIIALKEQLKKDDFFLQTVENNATEAYQNAIGYLQQEGLIEAVAYAFVDTGWIGTLQMSLQTLIGKPTYGYYFGLYERPIGTQKRQFQAFFFDENQVKPKIYFSNCLLETVFSEAEGMTLGYKKEDEAYQPIQSKNQNPNDKALVREEELLFSYMKYYLDACGNAVSATVSRLKMVQKLLAPLMGRPTTVEAEAYGSLLFCDDVLELQLQPVAAPMGWKEMKKQRFIPKLLRRMNIRKEELHDSAWPEGSYTIAGRSVRYQIHEERMYKRFVYLRKAIKGWVKNVF